MNKTKWIVGLSIAGVIALSGTAFALTSGSVSGLAPIVNTNQNQSVVTESNTTTSPGSNGNGVSYGMMGGLGANGNAGGYGMMGGLGSNGKAGSYSMMGGFGANGNGGSYGMMGSLGANGKNGSGR